MKPSKKNQVERWLESLSSFNTRRNYDLALREFCKDYDVTPDQTLVWKEQEIEDKIHDHTRKLLKAGLSGATVHIRFNALKMWFVFNRKRIIVKSKGLKTTKKRLDYIPTQEEVRQLLDSVGTKHKVMISLMSFGGLRPVDVATLQYKNVRASIERNDEVLTIEKVQQKTGQWYASFLGHQGTKYLKDYLRDQRGQLNDDDFVLVNAQGQPFQAHGITVATQRAINNSVGKYPNGPLKVFRPYSLRKYFKRAMKELGYETSEYLMGHHAGLQGLEARYDGIMDLDNQALEDLKGQFILMLPKLETEISEGMLIRQQEEHETEIMKLRIEIGHIKDQLTQEILDTMFKKVDMGLFNIFFEAPKALAHKALDESRAILAEEARQAQLTTKEVWENMPKQAVEGYEPEKDPVLQALKSRKSKSKKSKK